MGRKERWMEIFEKQQQLAKEKQTKGIDKFQASNDSWDELLPQLLDEE